MKKTEILYDQRNPTFINILFVIPYIFFCFVGRHSARVWVVSRRRAQICTDYNNVLRKSCKYIDPPISALSDYATGLLYAYIRYHGTFVQNSHKRLHVTYAEQVFFDYSARRESF